MNSIWERAPSWAEWYAVDQDGAEMLFAIKPTAYDVGRRWRRNGLYLVVSSGADDAVMVPHWRDALVQRPQEERQGRDTSPAGELPNTSAESYASDPSQEYRFTWWEPSSSDYGQWRKTKEEALSEAKENFHDFRDLMADRTVYIVECVLVASAPPHAEDAQ